jgi:ribosomal protein L40E
MCFRPPTVGKDGKIKCPICGALNPVTATKCIKCGAEETKVAAPKAPPPPRRGAPPLPKPPPPRPVPKAPPGPPPGPDKEPDEEE